MRMLAQRELSAFQLRQRLKKRGFAEPAIADAVTRLTASGSIDDRRVAFAFARNQLDVKRHGPLRAIRELEAIGIADDVAREAIAEAFGRVDESQMIDRAIARRRVRPGRLDPAEFRRLYAQLIRQGFSPDAVLRALKARGTGEPNDE